MAKHHTLEDMQRMAAQHGGLCLSTNYQNNYTKLRWQCAQGHQWEATFSTAQKWWCTPCARQQRSAARLEEMRALARKHGGKCLATRYISAKTPLLWQCANGHTWQAIPDSVARGTWCKQCQCHTLEDMQRLAAQHGGRCLSTHYTSTKTPLLWECARGHRWEAIPAILLRGHWCRRCYFDNQRPLKFQRMQQLAAARGGVCLSETYIDSKTPLLWQCARGHVWPLKPGEAVQGAWCPQCAILDRTRNPRKRKKYLVTE